jgi:hypothetical protein
MDYFAPELEQAEKITGTAGTEFPKNKEEWTFDKEGNYIMLDPEHDEPYRQAARGLAEDMDLDGLDDAVAGTDAHLIIVASDAGETALGSTGAYGEALAKTVDEFAVDVAYERAAELVGKSWDGESLVDNPNAKWAIDDTTRDAVRDDIVNGFAEHKTVDDITADILGHTAFSESRAELIARTEVQSLGQQPL